MNLWYNKITLKNICHQIQPCGELKATWMRLASRVRRDNRWPVSCQRALEKAKHVTCMNAALHLPSDLMVKVLITGNIKTFLNKISCWGLRGKHCRDKGLKVEENIDESKIQSMKGSKNQFIPCDPAPTLTIKQLLILNWVEGSDKEDRNDQTGPESCSLVLDLKL